MSVLIKGMEMPKSCWLCPLSILYKQPREALFCRINKEEVLRQKIDGNCPIVPVPQHGDLIERDAAYDKIAEQEGGNYVDMDAVGMGLNEMPTIIEAEEGE